MRVLSPSEARVVRVLIARDRPPASWPAGEASIPRRTLQSIRRRAFDRGWVQDRFLPEPAFFGYDRWTIAVASPLVDRAQELVDAWAARPECLHLYASEEAVLGFFASRRSHSRELANVLNADDMSRVSYQLQVASEARSVPAFFDFEAAWVRFAGLSGLLGYPHPFGGGLPHSDPAGARGPSLSHRKTIERIVCSAVDRTERSGPPSRERGFPWLRTEDRYFRRGWMTFRSFLDPTALAASVQGFPGWAAVVHGSLIPPHRPQELFRAMVGECGVGPFLFVTDDQEVLLATLSAGPGAHRVRPAADVALTIQRYLKGIAVVRWPWAGTRVPVAHRYDRLFEPAR